MKGKMLFFAFAMLTVCGMRSQDTTDTRPVVLPFWMVREVALDLSEKERLEEMSEITSLQLFKYQMLVQGLEKNNADFALQVELLQRKNERLEGELGIKNEIISKGSSFLSPVKILAVLAFGYFIVNFF